jgi:hypothetical protein
MRAKGFIFGFILVWGGVCLISPGWAQSANGSISGTVLDPSGTAVPDVELTLTSVEQQARSVVRSGPDGLYGFRNLKAGGYELKALAKDFREFVQKGIVLPVNQDARLDVHLELGIEAQTIEVLANASSLNFENAVRQDGVSPDTLAELPLMVSGGVRSSANFAILMPGVSTGGTANALDARINGGLQSGDETIMDGVSMQEAYMSQNGMVSIQTDFPLTPDMISEIKVVAANYEPQYGSTLSSAIVAVTKSRTDQFHGGGTGTTATRRSMPGPGMPWRGPGTWRMTPEDISAVRCESKGCGVLKLKPIFMSILRLFESEGA